MRRQPSACSRVIQQTHRLRTTNTGTFGARSIDCHPSRARRNTARITAMLRLAFALTVCFALLSAIRDWQIAVDAPQPFAPKPAVGSAKDQRVLGKRQLTALLGSTPYLRRFQRIPELSEGNEQP